LSEIFDIKKSILSYVIARSVATWQSHVMGTFALLRRLPRRYAPRNDKTGQK